MHAWLRRGNSASPGAVTSFTAETLARVAADFRPYALRADSGFLSTEFSTIWKSDCRSYVTAVRLNSHVERTVAGSRPRSAFGRALGRPRPAIRLSVEKHPPPSGRAKNCASALRPGLRRFISSDPMGFAGSGSNLYAYVGDDPVNATDPLGLMGFFAALADLFSSVMSGDFTWAVSCADFFTCLGAVAATEFGSFLRVATSTSGGGRQAPASAPPALTGSELRAQLAQRPGFAPTRNNYTPAPPGRHFDPRYLITVADAPVPSGKTGQPPSAQTAKSLAVRYFCGRSPSQARVALQAEPGAARPLALPTAPARLVHLLRSLLLPPGCGQWRCGSV